jgi:hypothetical protein
MIRVTVDDHIVEPPERFEARRRVKGRDISFVAQGYLNVVAG